MPTTRKIQHRDIIANFASHLTMPNLSRGVHFPGGLRHYRNSGAPPCSSANPLRDLGIRVNYGVDVLLVRTNTPQGSKIKAIPHPDYVITRDDSLVLAGGNRQTQSPEKQVITRTVPVRPSA